ncbi:24753_t:CDS:2, partial [Racocetra persica]
EFQKVFVNELNIFFGIESNKKAEEQLRKFRLDLEDELDNKVVVGARFEDFDNLAFEFAKQEQEDKQAKYSNLARSWPVLKQALRYWYPQEYEEFPQNLCILDKFYLPKNYVGKLNETNFVEYLEKKKGKIN